MTIDLVVVSNRIARGKPNEPMIGGLAAALLSVVEQSGATWVGSSDQMDSRGQNEPLVETLGKGKLVAVDLPAEHRSGYYNGFANSVLWPILHSRPDLVQFADVDYLSYCEINAVMAGALLKFCDQTRVWVHDYHFLTLGAELRNLEIKDKVDFKKTLGFFLHTPWPEPATIRHLPKHGELIRSMLAYELIGFQTDECRQNFIDCVGPDLGLISENSVVISRLGPDPMSGVSDQHRYG
ncbi:trehalose-6-phosphate synthase [Bradyrhizobium sp. LM2.7]